MKKKKTLPLPPPSKEREKKQKISRLIGFFSSVCGSARLRELCKSAEDFERTGIVTIYITPYQLQLRSLGT